MVPINTAPALQQAITSTYIYDIIVALAFVLVLFIIANLIKWRPGSNDNSGSVRRTWYFILAVVTVLTSLGLDYYFFLTAVRVPAFVGKYAMHMGIAAVLSGIAYAAISFIVIKVSRIGSKMESIFPKQDR